MTTPEEKRADARLLTKIRTYMYPDGGYRSAPERDGVLHGKDVDRYDRAARELNEAFAQMTRKQREDLLDRAFPEVRGPWVEADPTGPMPAGDVGGDYQASEAWGRRFVRKAPDLTGEWLVVDVMFYVEDPVATGWTAVQDPKNPRRLACQTTFTRCTDPTKPGDTESYEDSTYHTVPGDVSEEHAKILCASFSPDSIAWGGERIVHGPINKAAVIDHGTDDMRDVIDKIKEGQASQPRFLCGQCGGKVTVEIRKGAVVAVHAEDGNREPGTHSPHNLAGTVVDSADMVEDKSVTLDPEGNEVSDVGTPPRVVHPNVMALSAVSTIVLDEIDPDLTKVAVFAIGPPSGNYAVHGSVRVSPGDGAIVVHIDTDTNQRHVRVNVGNHVVFDGTPGELSRQ